MPGKKGDILRAHVLVTQELLIRTEKTVPSPPLTLSPPSTYTLNITGDSQIYI